MSLVASESGSDVEKTKYFRNDFTCLTELVREHYVKYLERQLRENLHAWQINSTVGKVDKAEAKIKQCVERLEDRALKACMMTQLYQRSMVKIIATVRRDTQENRLENTLFGLIKAVSAEKSSSRRSDVNVGFVDKATQTDVKYVGATQTNIACNHNGKNGVCCQTLTLEQKIDLFQAKFVERNAGDTHLPVPSETQNGNFMNAGTSERKLKPKVASRTRKSSKLLQFSPPVLSPMSNSSPVPTHDADQMTKAAETTAAPATELDDDVARELAVLFGEEKTELDDIFGIDPNAATDDPQINSILKEIENAKQTQINNKFTHAAQLPPANVSTNNNSTTNINEVDLSKSLWPCELYMQRRILNASLGRLIDEDYRWLDIMKDTFAQLFGEDSDDEFAIFSPSIDLDQVLMGSCIHRISPWVVQHLMKPLNDGLIGNRFLFKKLAKKLAESIIMDNQYPDESFVKQAVEHYFCLKSSVKCMQDLEDLSKISFKQLV